jgi:hypothetical protein
VSADEKYHKDRQAKGVRGIFHWPTNRQRPAALLAHAPLAMTGFQPHPLAPEWQSGQEIRKFIQKKPRNPTNL